MRNITPKTVEYGRTMIPPRRNSAPRRIYPSLTSEGIRPSGDQFSYISTPTCVSCSWTVWSAPAWQGSGPIPTAIRSGAASTIPKEFLVDVQARIRAVSFLPECEKIPQTGLISSPPVQASPSRTAPICHLNIPVPACSAKDLFMQGAIGIARNPHYNGTTRTHRTEEPL
jgi:hypothetical protein